MLYWYTKSCLFYKRVSGNVSLDCFFYRVSLRSNVFSYCTILLINHVSFWPVVCTSNFEPQDDRFEGERFQAGFLASSDFFNLKTVEVPILRLLDFTNEETPSGRSATKVEDSYERGLGSTWIFCFFSGDYSNKNLNPEEERLLSLSYMTGALESVVFRINPRLFFLGKIWGFQSSISSPRPNLPPPHPTSSKTAARFRRKESRRALWFSSLEQSDLAHLPHPFIQTPAWHVLICRIVRLLKARVLSLLDQIYNYKVGCFSSWHRE